MATAIIFRMLLVQFLSSALIAIFHENLSRPFIAERLSLLLLRLLATIVTIALAPAGWVAPSLLLYYRPN
jgi:hypothetical protein